MIEVIIDVALGLLFGPVPVHARDHVGVIRIMTIPHFHHSAQPDRGRPSLHRCGRAHRRPERLSGVVGCPWSFPPSRTPSLWLPHPCLDLLVSMVVREWPPLFPRLFLASLDLIRGHSSKIQLGCNSRGLFGLFLGKTPLSSFAAEWC